MKFLHSPFLLIAGSTLTIYVLFFYGMYGSNGDAFFHNYRYPIDRSYPAPQDGGLDQFEFAYLAENILAQNVFSLDAISPHTPETWRTPGYPAFIAFFLKLFRSYAAVVAAQICLVALTAWLILRMGEVLHSRKAGFIAATLYILSPAVIANALDILSDTLFVFLLTAAVYVLFFIRPQERLRQLYFFHGAGGLLLGLATLTRPLSLYMAFIFIPFSWWINRKFFSRKTGYICILIMLVGYSAVLAPWMLRNRRVSGNFALSSLGAYHLYFYGVGSFVTAHGNNPDYTVRQLLRDEINIHDEQQLRSFAASATLMDATLRHVQKEPVAYGAFYLQSVVRFFLATSIGGVVFSIPWLQNFFEALQLISKTSNKLTAPLFLLERMFWLGILILACIPLAMKKFREKRVWLALCAILVSYLAAFGGLFPSPRYRLPALPFLFTLAVIGFSSVRSLSTAKLLKRIAFAAAGSKTGRKIAGLLNRYGSLPRPMAFLVHGQTLYAKKLDRVLALWLLQHRALEDAETRIFSATVKPGWTVVDIGANLGYYTLCAAALVGRAGRVLAFEPDGDNFSMLQKNITVNHGTNISAQQKAVGAATGMARLFVCAEHSGDHKTHDTGEGRQSVVVEQVALDDLFRPGERVDLIKMDIQGGEMQALQGMQRILRENQNIILLCEFSPADLKKAGASPEQFLAALQNLHFTLAYINDETGGITSADPDELMQLCEATGYVNLFLKRLAFAH